jgi:hypothetical protein
VHVAAPQRPTATLPDINEHYADLGNGDLNEIYRILNKDDRWVLFLSGGGIGRERYYPEKRSKQLPLPRRNLWSTLHDAARSTAIIELKRKIMLGSWVTLGR